MFLPATQKEMKKLGWKYLDIILISGDAYIDSPFIGVSVIGKMLHRNGFKVGMISQPDISSKKDITRLGEPELFWGVSGGSIDSMVANYTASGKKRKTDDYTPGGKNDKRPDRAVILYSNLIRKYFKQTSPVVLGGIEASLRRIAHFDFWSNKIRRSVLLDAKADYLLYGMAERSVLELARCLKSRKNPEKIRGLCYVSDSKPERAQEMPSFEEVSGNKEAFKKMFHIFYKNNDPQTAVMLSQKYQNRYLIQNPPSKYLTQNELDEVFEQKYERDVHPFCLPGKVKALETIRFAVTTHRGCYGECNFCSISVHQGKTVRMRSRASIEREVKNLVRHSAFKGIIHDVGGPTANMFGFECTKKIKKGGCTHKRCLYPQVCSELSVDHEKQILLLDSLRKIKGIKKVKVASGIRIDMVLADKKSGLTYLNQLIRHHIGGQMKIAPEHSEIKVLDKMGKPGPQSLLRFKELFYALTKKEGLLQFLSYYIIAAHPGCSQGEMKQLKQFCLSKLKHIPKQIQIFTPTPSTYSTLMYWIEQDPFSGEPCFVEKSYQGREKQKKILTDVFMKDQGLHHKFLTK